MVYPDTGTVEPTGGSRCAWCACAPGLAGNVVRNPIMTRAVSLRRTASIVSSKFMSASPEGILTGQEALVSEIARRRTFAIISHPDAGKTTLTEKLLLYAGAIELAGAVRGSKQQRHAVSDWMEMEQQRGISISAAALEFELEGHHVTLLDTPGHQDFSEDTYRTLLAVDSVVMVLDAAKGVEPQTLKLFEVC